MVLSVRQRRNRLFFLLLIFSTGWLWAKPLSEQKVFAALTINLVRFTRWPESVFNKAHPYLDLCVFTDGQVQQVFDEFQTTRIKDRGIHIIYVSRLRRLQSCQVIFFQDVVASRLKHMLFLLHSQPILTVGQGVSFIQAGGIVGLDTVNHKPRLYINLATLKASGLIISARVLKLAEVFNFPVKTD